jgi:hypothetical protein
MGESTMKKLLLEDLAVESFATAAPTPAVGTVRGMEQTITVCNTWQVPDCISGPVNEQ